MDAKAYMEYLGKLVLNMEREAIMESSKAKESQDTETILKAEGVMATCEAFREVYDDFEKGNGITERNLQKPLKDLYEKAPVPEA